MKRRAGSASRGEGWTVFAGLIVFALASLLLWWSRLPREIWVEPVLHISEAAFATSAPEMVNINAASPRQLAALPGLGEALAERIVAHRQANGPFLSIEELDEVYGIGQAKLAALRGLVYAGAPVSAE